MEGGGELSRCKAGDSPGGKGGIVQVKRGGEGRLSR